MKKYIDDHPTGAEATLVLHDGLNISRFPTHLVEKFDTKTKRYVMLEVVTQEDSYPILNKGPVELEILNPEYHRIYKYRIQRCGYIQYKNQFYIVVFSDQETAPYNARQAYRCLLTTDVNLQVAKHSKIINCISHDISFTGMAIIGDSSLSTIRLHNTCKVIFDYEDLHLQMSGMIKRIESLNNGKVLVGIEFTQTHDNIARLLTILQMKDAKIRREKQQSKA